MKFSPGADGTAAGCSSIIDPDEAIIISAPGSEHHPARFSISHSSSPSSKYGPICDGCIDVLLKYDRIEEIPSERPPNYDITFAVEGRGQTGYAFMCYDEAHWEEFVSSMTHLFRDNDLAFSHRPKPDDLPAIVICRGKTSGQPGKDDLQIDILPNACIFRDAG